MSGQGGCAIRTDAPSAKPCRRLSVRFLGHVVQLRWKTSLLPRPEAAVRRLTSGSTRRTAGHGRISRVMAVEAVGPRRAAAEGRTRKSWPAGSIQAAPPKHRSTPDAPSARMLHPLGCPIRHHAGPAATSSVGCARAGFLQDRPPAAQARLVLIQVKCQWTALRGRSGGWLRSSEAVHFRQQFRCVPADAAAAGRRPTASTGASRRRQGYENAHPADVSVILL